MLVSNYGRNQNNFGAKTSASKAERTYLSKTSKAELMNQALSLGIMVDDNLTKQQIFNLIKKSKLEKVKLLKPPKETSIDMSELLESLPVPPKKPTYDYSKIRESDVLYYPDYPRRRFPPGSKVIRKELGMTKQQKTEARREIKEQIDYLSDLLKSF